MYNNIDGVIKLNECDDFDMVIEEGSELSESEICCPNKVNPEGDEEKHSDSDGITYDMDGKPNNNAKPLDEDVDDYNTDDSDDDDTDPDDLLDDDLDGFNIW